MKGVSLVFAFIIGYGVAIYTPIVKNVDKIMKELEKLKYLEDKVDGIDRREDNIISGLKSHKEAIEEINEKLKTVRINKNVRIVIEEER